MASGLAYSSKTSLPAIRGEHLALQKAWAELDRNAILDRATDIRLRAAEVGHWIEDPAERDVAQGIVDYWSGMLANLPGQSFPELIRLADFDPLTARAAEARAREVYEDLSADEQGEARRLFLSLVAPPVGARLSDARRLPSGSAAVRDKFVQAGVITTTPGGDDYVIAHERLLRGHWPQLEAWMADQQLDEAMFVKLSKSATLWAAYRQNDDLLRGAPLQQAMGHRDRSPEIMAYLDASSRRQLARRGAVTVASAASIAIASALFTWGWGLKDDTVILRDEVKTTNANLAEVTAASQAPATRLEQQELLGAPGREGYLWIGNQSRPLLREWPSGRLAPPSTVAKNQSYRAITDIALRAGYPDANYKSADRTGVVEAGAMVVALEAPRIIERPSGNQFWLRVRKPVTVYIQFKGDPAQAEALRKKLLDQGYDAPLAENMGDGSVPPAEVRFFRPEEQPFAERLSTDLNAVLEPEGEGPRRTCELVSPRRLPRRDQLEVWIDFTRSAVAAEVDCAA